MADEEKVEGAEAGAEAPVETPAEAPAEGATGAEGEAKTE